MLSSSRSGNPAGGMEIPRLVPSAPVANTKSSSICGRVTGSLLRGMKMRSWVRRLFFGRKMALPVRLRFLVICETALRLPVIWAVLRCCGMVFSVIMTIMKRPMSKVENPSLMVNSV